MHWSPQRNTSYFCSSLRSWVTRQGYVHLSYVGSWTCFLLWDVILHFAVTARYYFNQASQEYYKLFKKALPITSLHSFPNRCVWIHCHNLGEWRRHSQLKSWNKLVHLGSQELGSSQRAESTPLSRLSWHLHHTKLQSVSPLLRLKDFYLFQIKSKGKRH